MFPSHDPAENRENTIKNTTNKTNNDENRKLNEKNTALNTAYQTTLTAANRTKGGDYVSKRDLIRNVGNVDQNVLNQLENDYKTFYRKEKLQTWDVSKGANLLMERSIQNIMGMQTLVLQILGRQQLQTMILTSPNGMEVKADII